MEEERTEEERTPLTPREFETAAALDQEAADRRRQENERLKAHWMQRHPPESVGDRILKPLPPLPVSPALNGGWGRSGGYQEGNRST